MWAYFSPSPPVEKDGAVILPAPGKRLSMLRFWLVFGLAMSSTATRYWAKGFMLFQISVLYVNLKAYLLCCDLLHSSGTVWAPLVHVLTPWRTHEYNLKAFSAIILPDGVDVMMDFELALRATCKKHQSTHHILGCLFNLIQVLKPKHSNFTICLRT